MNKVKVLLLGDSPIALYALQLLKDYDVYIVRDGSDSPSVNIILKDFKPMVMNLIRVGKRD